ncbi:MAG: efflux RND transporter periplasmic adaptor subunit [Bacteroidales bacterium]|nr:efflux RND transporter periplasmic adaptor subunit [Bacteroidales bacterium]MCF8351091.1 efflux RND transporter periplasmic adaptor subunit [Bacteroidales bacterium]MCF8376811.1 efflux RND transporter periplasmic adaptor subunit [Bacteroidales bacterium]MCF8400718.1 efflux RND transporter periplasmic adaptor subunit [Bacteroidales bacterium]
MKKFFRILIIVVILGVFGYTIYFLFQKSKEEPVVYETGSPVEMPIVKKTVATGSVVPRKEIEIVPQVSGLIDELYVTEGDMIKKGDLIARIKIIPNMVNLNNAESRLNRARINLKNEEVNFNRIKDLYQQGVIAKQEYELAELTYNTAREELEAAGNNLALIKEGQMADANKETNTIVRSTVDGMVLDVPVEIGNSVIETNTFNPGTTISIVADMSDMIFEGKIDETEVGNISEGMKLILTVGAIENVSFDAELEHIAPKGVEENGAIQFEIRANVNLQQGQFIRAGYSATAAIVLEQTRGSVLALEERLLQFDGDTAFVEVETAPQQFEKRVVKTGISDGIHIQIVDGITKDDKIKIAG